jgi:hypothetical protein
MSRRAEQHRAELEAYRKTKEYYASIRRPGLERVTFGVALAAAIAAAGRILNLWLIGYGEWITVIYAIAFVSFVGLDSIFTRADHPVDLPLGGFNPSRIYEKFAMQERAWQVLVVLMLPLTARLVLAIIVATQPVK